MALGPEYYTAGKHSPLKKLNQVTMQTAPNTALCLAQKQQKEQSNTYGNLFKPTLVYLYLQCTYLFLNSTVVIDLRC